MESQDIGSENYDLLESWKNQLQISYVKLAMQVARYEQSSHIEAERAQYRHLDRIAHDIERAEYALKLYRLQHINMLAPLMAGARSAA